VHVADLGVGHSAKAGGVPVAGRHVVGEADVGPAQADGARADAAGEEVCTVLGDLLPLRRAHRGGAQQRGKQEQNRRTPTGREQTRHGKEMDKRQRGRQTTPAEKGPYKVRKKRWRCKVFGVDF
jgi:hypothetical protein